MTERTPPYDIEAERAVIGSALLDNQVIEAVEVIISAGDFYTEAHKKIFGAILTHYKKTPIDIITLGKLLDKQTLEKIGGLSYISSLVDNVPSAVNAEHYAQIVKEFSLRRQLLQAAYKTSLAAHDLSQPIDEVIENSQKEALNINPISTENHIKTAGEIARRTIDMVEFRNKGGIYGISTGLTDVDEIMGGIAPGKFIVAAGRPGMGKTAFMLNVARSAGNQNKATLIFSLEMLNEYLMVRMLSTETKIENRQIVRGYIRESEWSSLITAAGNISECPLYFDDMPIVTPLELKTRVRKAIKDYGINLVIIDYLQLINSTSKGERREREVAEISRTLKLITREYAIPVIAISQLNRELERRPDKRPVLSDLRESGAIEADADIVVFLYRDEVYNKEEDNPERGLAEINIAKNRDGAVGTAKVVFSDKYQQFSNLVKHYSTNYRQYND
jgi:replicative DNA helicase